MQAVAGGRCTGELAASRNAAVVVAALVSHWGRGSDECGRTFSSIGYASSLNWFFAVVANRRGRMYQKSAAAKLGHCHKGKSKARSPR